MDKNVFDLSWVIYFVNYLQTIYFLMHDLDKIRNETMDIYLSLTNNFSPFYKFISR